jgi:hypothetical protein
MVVSPLFLKFRITVMKNDLKAIFCIAMTLTIVAFVTCSQTGVIKLKRIKIPVVENFIRGMEEIRLETLRKKTEESQEEIRLQVMSR